MDKADKEINPSLGALPSRDERAVVLVNAKERKSRRIEGLGGPNEEGNRGER